MRITRSNGSSLQGSNSLYRAPCHRLDERTSYDNGDIKLFDLRTMQLRWDTNVKNGVTHVAFDRKDIKMNKLAVSCLEATMIVYDMRRLDSSYVTTHDLG